MKPIPSTSPWDEYEHMRGLRCECGGAFRWGERTCERRRPPRAHLVLDRYPLTCQACGLERTIDFLCDTGSTVYQGLAGSLATLAAALGPEGGAALLASELVDGAAKPRKTRRPRRKGPQGRRKNSR